MIAHLPNSGGGHNCSLSWWGSDHCSLALHFRYSSATFCWRGSISIAHLLVSVGVTTAHFLGGDHMGFLLVLPFVPCLGSTSTIYPLIIEEVKLTASLALLRPFVF